MKNWLKWSEEQRSRISILLTIIALLLWSHSILYAKLEIGHWGLISGLPVTFFVALALLTVASAILWVAKEKHGKLLFLQLLILILALDLVPLITGGSSPFINHGYRNLGYVDYIVRHNHFDIKLDPYMSWPGAFILSAIISKIGSINFEPLIETAAIIQPILVLLPLYIFLKNTLGEERSNYIWAGCWLFCLAGSTVGNLISAMGTAIFLLVVMLALVTNPSLWRKDSKSFSLFSLMAIIFAAMAVTHLLTALAALCIIAALAVVRLDKRLALAVGACLVILVAWHFTGALGFTQKKLPQEGEVTVVEQTQATKGMIILDPEVLMEREVTGHLSGSQSHADVARIRILFAGIIALIGLAGLISAFVMRRDFKTTLALLVITLAPIVLITLSGHYASEILGRIYSFARPGMAYFGATLLYINKRTVVLILCLILLIALPLYVIDGYGNAQLDYFSPAERSGTFFFHNETSGGLVFGTWTLGTVKNIELYERGPFEELAWEDNRVVFPESDLTYYIGISRQDRARYEWLKGEADFIGEMGQRLQSAVNSNFIYNNPDLKLYISEVYDAAEGG